MSAASNTVVHLHRRVPQEALERLNRLTGLRFSNWPESLLEELGTTPSGADLREYAAVQDLRVHPV